MKRILAVCAAVGFMLPQSEFSVAYSETVTAQGAFGEHITWSIEDDTLFLQGSGTTDTGSIFPVDVISIQPFSSDTLDQWYNKAWAESADAVKHIVVSEGITQIQDYAFCLFPSLESVELPDSLETVAPYAFMGCPKLEQITISPDTEVSYVSFQFDSKLYDEENQFLMFYPDRLIDYCGTEQTSVVIPETVTAIIGGVFSGHTEIESVTLPEHISDIGSGAFSGCSIKEITLPESIQTIAAGTFQGCTELKSVTLPDSLTTIEKNAFSGCTALEQITIPNTVQTIGTGAFSENAWLKTAGDYVVVGDGILYCFQGNQKVLTIPKTVKTILGGASASEAAISGTKIVEIQIPDTVTELQANAINCENAVIIGKSGSAAEAYANANGMSFQDSAALPQGADLTLDYTSDGWYFGNSGKVFGGDYVLNDLDRQRLNELGISTNTDKSWGGSCIGLSVTAILAKNGVFSPAQLQTGAETLSEIEPTDNIVSFINYYQCIQGRDGTSTAYEPDFLKFYRMLNIAKNIPYGESPFLLTFATKNASHAVVGYGQEEGVWTFDGKVYDGRILVWDSNFPSALHQESCLYYDSQTFDYCIPYYGVHVADGASDNTAGIITVCNDLSVLNAYPYPFELHYEPGDINCDGRVSVADAVLLARHLTVQTNLTESQLLLADISADGAVNAADLTLLKRGLAGK